MAAVVVDELTAALIEGPCNISVKRNGTANGTASPGYLGLVNGTLSFGGHTTFNGVIYTVNARGRPNGSNTTCPNGSDVVITQGNAQ